LPNPTDWDVEWEEVMRKFVGLLFAACVAAAAGQGAAQRAPDAVIIDPDVHHVVMENDHVRVFEARAAAGTRSPMHSHPPLVVVSVGSARIKLTLPDGTTQRVDLRPGTVLWQVNPEHSWELLAGELHVVAVEVKSAQAAKSQ
jgi:hypothetical protein